MGTLGPTPNKAAANALLFPESYALRHGDIVRHFVKLVEAKSSYGTYVKTFLIPFRTDLDVSEC